MLRELREEIGMTDHAGIDLVSGFKHRPDYRRGRASLFVVRGVHYRPRWSLEVKQVGEFDLGALPAGTAEVTLRLLELAGVAYGSNRKSSHERAPIRSGSNLP